MDYVRVTGTIERDGNFTPGWWSTPSAEPVRSGPSVPDVSAKWAAVALDEHEQIIARTPASVLEVPVCPNVPQLHLDAVLAIPATTKAVAIRDGDREAYRRLVPSPARLSLDGPGGLVADQWVLEFRVRIEGPEPRPGAYLVARWQAPNHPPLPLGLIDVGEGKPAVVRANLAELPDGEGCRLSAAYQDGIHTFTAFSEPLTIRLRPAIPLILAPTSNTRIFDNGWLSLEGRLDGNGDLQSLEWFMDKERIAAGPRAGVARPPAGTHIIKLQSGTAYAETEIVVLSAGNVASPPWTPHWRSQPFRFGSTLAGPRET